MFPTNDNDELNTNPESSQPAPPQGSYPPVESPYPPADGTYTPSQQSNPYSSQPQTPSNPSPDAQQPGQWQNPYSQQPASNPYGSQPQSPNPYGSQPANNPYSTPLAGAPNSQPNPNPYSQPQPNPYSQPTSSPYGQQTPYGQSNPYGQQPPNPYSQQTNNPYPAPQTNQPWPPQPGGFGGTQYGGGYSVPVDANRILTYGILSFICFGIILGPMAFIQGTQAINAIDSGQADPSLRGKVQAGRICGAIGGVLSLLGIIFQIISLMHR